MATVDISIFSLFLALLLLTVPIVLSRVYGIGLIRSLIYSTIRMSIQLVLIGIFLKYLFTWNNTILNIIWLAVMILAAVFSVIRGSAMKASKVLVPAYISFSLATFTIVLFLNIAVIRLDYVFDARYLIVLGGMLLGNSLRGNIVGITAFYTSIKKDKKKFLYTLSLGASFNEAILPYLKESIQLALKPTLAAMATMGIVALPGMMTGVILGGTSPEVAIKYQIMIMIGIVTSTIVSVFLTILMTLRVCFSKYGILKEDVFV
ncbi:MAG: ABC transporter permease [Candidatus Omnitrophica bacterium]|nr:ABC transporter permease [Candidatus Omnitrophota bacterium]